MSSTQASIAPELSAERLLAFEPSAERVHFLSRRMRSGLAQSLRYIVEEAGDQLQLPLERLNQFLAQLETRPISPQAFCMYYDAVIAFEEDDPEKANRELAELIQLPAHPGGPVILDLPRESEPARKRYERFTDADVNLNFGIFSPSAEASSRCHEQIKDAFELIEKGDPDLAAEIRALVLEIILAAGTEGPNVMTFDGASAFMLWGGIMINANRRDGPVGMVQMLAHESAHDLLYGLCANEPLVENSPEDLYPSPLRVDPRPMEGIYHATFVTARMYRTVKQLLDSGVLSGKMVEQAQKDLVENARLFFKGFETVKQHAILSPLGEGLIQGASRYMTAATKG